MLRKASPYDSHGLRDEVSVLQRKRLVLSDLGMLRAELSGFEAAVGLYRKEIKSLAALNKTLESKLASGGDRSVSKREVSLKESELQHYTELLAQIEADMVRTRTAADHLVIITGTDVDPMDLARFDALAQQQEAAGSGNTAAMSSTAPTPQSSTKQKRPVKRSKSAVAMSSGGAGRSPTRNKSPTAGPGMNSTHQLPVRAQTAKAPRSPDKNISTPELFAEASEIQNEKFQESVARKARKLQQLEVMLVEAQQSRKRTQTQNGRQLSEARQNLTAMQKTKTMLAERIKEIEGAIRREDFEIKTFRAKYGELPSMRPGFSGTDSHLPTFDDHFFLRKSTHGASHADLSDNNSSDISASENNREDTNSPNNLNSKHGADPQVVPVRRHASSSSAKPGHRWRNKRHSHSESNEEYSDAAGESEGEYEYEDEYEDEYDESDDRADRSRQHNAKKTHNRANARAAAEPTEPLQQDSPEQLFTDDEGISAIPPPFELPPRPHAAGHNDSANASGSMQSPANSLHSSAAEEVAAGFANYAVIDINALDDAENDYFDLTSARSNAFRDTRKDGNNPSGGGNGNGGNDDDSYEPGQYPSDTSSSEADHEMFPRASSHNGRHAEEGGFLITTDNESDDDNRGNRGGGVGARSFFDPDLDDEDGIIINRDDDPFDDSNNSDDMPANSKSPNMSRSGAPAPTASTGAMRPQNAVPGSRARGGGRGTDAAVPEPSQLTPENSRAFLMTSNTDEQVVTPKKSQVQLHLPAERAAEKRTPSGQISRDPSLEKALRGANSESHTEQNTPKSRVEFVRELDADLVGSGTGTGGGNGGIGPSSTRSRLGGAFSPDPSASDDMMAMRPSVSQVSFNSTNAHSSSTGGGGGGGGGAAREMSMSGGVFPAARRSSAWGQGRRISEISMVQRKVLRGPGEDPADPEEDNETKMIQLNHYTILRGLGSGSSAKVKLAVDNQTGRTYAIKEIKRQMAGEKSRLLLKKKRGGGTSTPGGSNPGSAMNTGGSAEDIARSPHISVNSPEVSNSVLSPISPSPSNTLSPLPDFKRSKIYREINVLKKLNHPNIVNLHEIIDDSGHDKVYLVLDYVEGGCILEEEDYKYNRRLDEYHTWKYMRDIASGLSYLHSRGVIHYDLKPTNMLVTAEDVVKITDFGMSRFLDEINASRRSLTGTIGSPAYSAPETFDGQWGKPADMWSLGVCLYQFVFGTIPFQGNTLIELIENIRTQELQFPFEPANQALGDLIHELLQKDVSSRITVEDLREHDWITLQGRNPLAPIPIDDPLGDSLEESQILLNDLDNVSKLFAKYPEVLATCKEIHVTAGTVLVEPGAPVRHMFLVKSGELEIGAFPTQLVARHCVGDLHQLLTSRKCSWNYGVIAKVNSTVALVEPGHLETLLYHETQDGFSPELIKKFGIREEHWFRALKNYEKHHGKRFVSASNDSALSSND